MNPLDLMKAYFNGYVRIFSSVFSSNQITLFFVSLSGFSRKWYFAMSDIRC